MRIEIDDVHKRYGDVTALTGCSFVVPSGTTFGLLGTNGAGKTTLFRLLVGHESPDSGRITVGGLDVADGGVRVRERVGYLPDRIGFPERLTGREALAFVARMRGVPRVERDRRIAEALSLVGLSEAADRTIGGYSSGMGRRLGLASVLLDRPPVLVLDEPTAGLDLRGVGAFHDVLTRVREETGATVLLASHALSEIERCCDAAAILHDGRPRAVGSIEDLRPDGPSAVRLRTSDATRSKVVEIANRYGDVDIEAGVVSVECLPGDTLGLLETIDATSIDGLVIEEPGLDAAFSTAIEGVSS
jgi:Cu-processing system ATP-binding protein